MPVHECFSHGELEDYALGKLTVEISQYVTEHLMGCAECETVVASLDAASDTVVEFLKRPSQTDRFADEPVYQQALQKVKSLDPQHAEVVNQKTGKAASRATPAGTSDVDARSASSHDAPDVRDYRLLSKLGEGGMGAVFKAVHTKLDRTVALKVLPAERMRNEQSVIRFEREMKAVGKLDHPAIVRATDAGEIDGTWFLAMELIDGFNLAKLSDLCAPLPVADACELIRQAAIGLQYVHEQGMVHRDIKPSNLMLTESGQVKILDLGLAWSILPPRGRWRRSPEILGPRWGRNMCGSIRLMSAGR